MSTPRRASPSPSVASAPSARTLETRERILATARSLLVERGYHEVGMADIARAAGLTRQAVYLHHFASKAELLLALAAWAEEVEGVAELLRPIRAAPDALDALERTIAATAESERRLHAITRCLDAARLSDGEAEAAWQDRMRGRRANLAWLARALEREGRLKPDWTVAAATDFLFALLSTQSYHLLVVERGWSLPTFVRRIGDSARATLLRPAPRGRGSVKRV